MTATPREQSQTYLLGKLARELELRGIKVALHTNPTSLRVIVSGSAAETVECVDAADGWFYCWSWGDIVESADDPSAAADRILRSFGTPMPPPRPSLD
ncbi:hypothetical protein [Acrocarpospora sp. B8E8]|uniref:hypothetical protein n=1 Tax=Acrocarpospora sp. B8E8 TaxID=3153572 RepID=UPI00325D38BF